MRNYRRQLCTADLPHPLRVGKVLVVCALTLGAFFGLGELTDDGMEPLWALGVRLAGVFGTLGGILFVVLSNEDLAHVRRLVRRGRG